jgi:hypothetical protein
VRKWSACLALTFIGSAQAASPITDRFFLRGTYFKASAATDLRVDPTSASPGTELSAEDDLGLDDEVNQARVELLFRLRQRNRIRMDFFSLDRNGTEVLEEEVIFGDEVFEVGDVVVSELDYRMLTFTYTYSFLRNERIELGGGLGIHLIETEARGAVPADFQREEESQGGALPSVALDLAWLVSPRFALAVRGNYFTASVDEFDGVLSDYHVDLQYRARPNLAFGMGYSSIVVELDVTDPDNPGRFHMTTRGPELFFRVSY